MMGEKDKKFVFGDSVLRSTKKTQLEWEHSKDSEHPMCKRMFVYARRINDEALKSEVYIVVKEINSTLQRAVQLLDQGKNITDQQLFIEAQILKLINAIDHFLNGKSIGYIKPVQDLKKYSGGTFSKFVRNLPIKK